jgi:hypothetical protein
MNLVSTKNFVLANAVETMLAPARKPSLPPPPATAKADFGKVPAYLEGVKARLAAEKAAETERKLAEVRIVRRLVPAVATMGARCANRAVQTHASRFCFQHNRGAAFIIIAQQAHAASPAGSCGRGGCRPARGVRGGAR